MCVCVQVFCRVSVNYFAPLRCVRLRYLIVCLGVRVCVSVLGPFHGRGSRLSSALSSALRRAERVGAADGSERLVVRVVRAWNTVEFGVR